MTMVLETCRGENLRRYSFMQKTLYIFPVHVYLHSFTYYMHKYTKKSLLEYFTLPLAIDLLKKGHSIQPHHHKLLHVLKSLFKLFKFLVTHYTPKPKIPYIKSSQILLYMPFEGLNPSAFTHLKMILPNQHNNIYYICKSYAINKSHFHIQCVIDK